MKTLLVMALLAPLALSPAYGSEWCPVEGRNNATRALPPDARVSLDETGHITPNFGLPTDVWDVSLVPQGGNKLDEIDPREVNLAGDLTGYELWLQREFNVYSELQFQPCP